MSSSRPYPPHAPPANPIAGYTVMSWHWEGPGRTPSFDPGGGAPTSASTMPWIAARSAALSAPVGAPVPCRARTTRSEEHTSELQSPFLISYAVFCSKKKTHLARLESLYRHVHAFVAVTPAEALAAAALFFR